MPLNKNIFLIGFMGSGKSYWGKLWSEKNCWIFLDLDYEVEKHFDLSIKEIFQKFGENVFRRAESDLLKNIEPESCSLVACGGGVPCFFDNMKWMKNNGTVIYLKASPDNIFSRIKDEMDKRPLLKGMNDSELMKFIQQKLQEREVFYSQADFILNVENLNVDSISSL